MTPIGNMYIPLLMKQGGERGRKTDTFGVSHLLQPSTQSKPDLNLDQGHRTLKWPAVFQLKGDSYLSWSQMRAHFWSWCGQ